MRDTSLTHTAAIAVAVGATTFVQTAMSVGADKIMEVKMEKKNFVILNGDINLRFRGHTVTITNNHSSSSYGYPVVLYDGTLTNAFYTGEVVQPPQRKCTTCTASTDVPNVGTIDVHIWTTSKYGFTYKAYSLGPCGALGTIYICLNPLENTIVRTPFEWAAKFGHPSPGGLTPRVIKLSGGAIGLSSIKNKSKEDKKI